MIDVDAKALGEQRLVDPVAIERELATLWTNAGADEAKSGVTRACAWNLVVHVERRPERDGAAAADRLVGAMKELPRYIASRTIFLETYGAEADRPALESWISANCLLAEQGGKYVCSEEITVLSRAEGERHLPGLVRALTIPDVPTAMIYATLPRMRDATANELIGVADRLIVDALLSRSDSALSDLLALFPRCGLGVSDLGWRSTAPLRQAVSDLFEGSAALGLSDVERVRILAPRHRASMARLLLQWIAACMGSESVTWTTKYDGRAEGGRSLGLEIREGEELSEIAFLGRREPLIARADLATTSDVLLLAESLASRREDPGLRRALMIGS